MLRPYILCRHTAYVGTHRRPQCAPACSPSSLPSAPRVLEAIRPSPPPTATRSPSASGIRSSRSRGSPGRAGWGARCGRRIPRAPEFGPPTASPRESSPPGGERHAARRARRVRAVEPVRLVGDAPARALLAALRRPPGGGARRHPHAARAGRPGATRGTLVCSWHEGVPLPPRDHGARVVGGGDHRPRRAYRRLGQSRSRGAAPRYRERRDSPDHPHPHPAAHGPHLGAFHPGRERDFGRPGGLAHAGVLAQRAVGRDPHVHRCGADELVRLGVRRRLRPDRALPPHRSDGPPARLMDRTLAALGAVSALAAVAAGAFGAHALRARLAPDQLAAFETGARYQMYHALALLLAAWAMTRWAAPPVGAARWLCVVGTVSV